MISISRGTSIRQVAIALTLALVGSTAAIVAAPINVRTAFATDGDAQPLLTDKTTPQATATSGQTIQYVITYTCSNSLTDVPVDGCDAAVFSDPIPKFTNIYGQLQPLEFVDATGPATEWPSGFTLDVSDAANPKVVGTAGTWAPGVSGAIFINTRVPMGVVPVAPQNVTNVALIDDPAAADDFSTVATTSISSTAPVWAISKLGPNTTRMNRNVAWVISVCGPSTSTLWPLYTITDTLPAGTQYVSSTYSGTYADDNIGIVVADAISDGAGVITWNFDANFRPPLGSDGCFRMNVTGRFPSGYVDPASADHANDDNVGSAVKTNVATGTGRNLPADTGTSIGTAPWSTSLIGAAFGIGDGGTYKSFTNLTGADNFYTIVGDTGVFNLQGNIDSDLPADTLTLTDGTHTFFSGSGANPTASGNGLPLSFQATTLDPGVWSGSLTATIRGSNDNFATSTVIASGVASNASNITLSPSYRSFRWVWGGTTDAIPGDFSYSGLRIIGTLGTNAPQSDFGLYRNTSTMSVVRGADTLTDTDFDEYILETPTPHPSITKSVANATRQPGQTTTYTLSIGNSADATANVVNPYIEDCVPDFITIQGTPTAGSGWSVGTPLPTCTTGQTPLRYNYTGTLTPGQSSSTITYVAMVDGSSPGPIAPPGTYPNIAYIYPSGGGTFGHCVNTSPVCGSRAEVIVSPTVSLASQKCVTGDLDAGIFRPNPSCASDPVADKNSAQTLPGGEMAWELRLRNAGNVDATNIDFIDIFPHVGDTAVITETSNPNDGTTLNVRNTEFTPYLVTPITPPSGWVVSYSISANPCRPEVGRNVSCDAPAWNASPTLAQLPTFKSVKFSYTGTLSMGATATFSWRMRAPVFDATYDQGGSNSADPYEFLRTCVSQAASSNSQHCPRAVNSFAYGANATNLPTGVPAPSRLYAEPPAVEVRVIAPPRPNAVGNRVWLDRNFDGLQGSDTSPTGEPGLDSVYVELYRDVSGTFTLYAFTYTDQNGNYLFSGGDVGLPDGVYKIRFYPPSNYYVSPRDVSGGGTDTGAPDPGDNPGTNTDDDSDGDEEICFACL